jgi:hypothetical protein
MVLHDLLFALESSMNRITELLLVGLVFGIGLGYWSIVHHYHQSHTTPSKRIVLAQNQPE